MSTEHLHKGSNLSSYLKVTSDITLQNENGDDIKISNLVQDNSVVLFIYPKANTPGCTKQAQLYQSNIKSFDLLGFKVFGLSKDKPSAQSNWKKKYNLEYSFLCDPESKLIGIFGCTKNSSVLRSHIVIAKGGDVLDIRRNISPGESCNLALSTLKDEEDSIKSEKIKLKNDVNMNKSISKKVDADCSKNNTDSEVDDGAKINGLLRKKKIKASDIKVDSEINIDENVNAIKSSKKKFAFNKLTDVDSKAVSERKKSLRKRTFLNYSDKINFKNKNVVNKIDKKIVNINETKEAKNEFIKKKNPNTNKSIKNLEINKNNKSNLKISKSSIQVTNRDNESKSHSKSKTSGANSRDQKVEKKSLVNNPNVSDKKSSNSKKNTVTPSVNMPEKIVKKFITKKQIDKNKLEPSKLSKSKVRSTVRKSNLMDKKNPKK